MGRENVVEGVDRLHLLEEQHFVHDLFSPHTHKPLALTAHELPAHLARHRRKPKQCFRLHVTSTKHRHLQIARLPTHLEIPRGFQVRGRRVRGEGRENARKIAEHRDFFAGGLGGRENPREMEDNGGAAIEGGDQIL